MKSGQIWKSTGVAALAAVLGMAGCQPDMLEPRAEGWESGPRFSSTPGVAGPYELEVLSNWTRTGAYGLNDLGSVVGTATDILGHEHPVRWDNGTAAYVDTRVHQHWYSVALAINIEGTVVGDDGSFPMVWKDGGSVQIEAPQNMFVLRGAAFSINASGRVVGYFQSFNSTIAFAWDGQTSVDLGSVNGGTWAEASSINDLGEIVGRGGTPDGERALLWVNDEATNLGVLSGGTKSAAKAINNKGRIVGSSGSSSGQRAVLWENGGIRDLGVLPGGTYSEALAINDHGQVVGRSGSLHGDRAFLWQNGEMIDLGVLPGGSKSGARGINNKGQIVGFSDSSHGTRAVVWTVPVPGPPQRLSLTEISASQIELSWTPDNAAETHFELRRRAKGSGDWSGYASLTTVPAGALSYVDGGLTPGVRYQYVIRGCDGKQCSAWTPSEPLTLPQTAPETPSDLLASAASASTVHLTWTNQGGSGSRFELQRRINTHGAWGGYLPLDTVTAGSTSYHDSRLTPGSRYQYAIRACNGTRCSAWTAASPITLPQAVPNAPNGLATSAVSTSQIQLEWTSQGGAETRFELRRRIRSGGVWGGYAPLDTVPASERSYVDSGLTPGSRYQYQIRACTSTRCSAWVGSHPVSLEAEGPQAPTSLSVMPLLATWLHITWASADPTTQTFELDRRWHSGSGSWSEYERVREFQSDVVGYPDSVPTGRYYQYRIRACNGTGCSAWLESTAVAHGIGP